MLTSILDHASAFPAARNALQKGPHGSRGTNGMQAIDALREIFTVALLPDRKLVSFEDQPLSAVPSGKDGLRCLLYYHFEDQLKKRCDSMLQFTVLCLHGTPFPSLKMFQDCSGRSRENTAIFCCTMH